MDINKIKLALQQEVGFQGEVLGVTELNNLELDSLDMISFLFAIEQETGVKIPDEAISNGSIKTIQCLIDFINNGHSK